MRLSKTKKHRVVTLFAALLVASVTAAKDVHVAPDGKPTGDGTIAKPYDIFTVFAGKPVEPGDRVILKGGQYDGPETVKKNADGSTYTVRAAFKPTLAGTEAQPIVITSAPGESAHLNGAIAITDSHYVHFVRLEIGDLKWDPYREKHQVPTAFNAVSGTKLKLINCNIFGGAMGTGLWRKATDLEAYGNLIHDFGQMRRSGGRGGGHALYMQNTTGTKTLKHNIAWRGCGWNFDIYTQQGEIKGFDVLENISFIPGWYKEGQVSFNYGLTGRKPAERIRFIGNVAYQPRDMQQWRSNMRLMYADIKGLVHDDAVVKDNYVMGTHRALVVSHWRKMTITGNTFWSTGPFVEVSSAPSGSGIPHAPPKPELSNYTIDDNTYYNNGVDKPFVYSASEKYPQEDTLTFEEWRKLGFDKNSTIQPGRANKPTGTKVFVFPNTHEQGRANVAVFNWDGKASVDVDLSKALRKGQGYVIYNCLDIKQTLAKAEPILTGTFAGGTVTLPTRQDKDCPAFDAYLVLPQPPNK